MNNEIFKSDELRLVFQDALANEENDNILKLTSDKIEKIKMELFHELDMDKEKRDNLMLKLKDYRFIDDMSDFKEGAYIRWLDLSKIKDINDAELKKGAFIAETSLFDDDIHITCKTIMQRYIEILGSKNLIFQKLSDQEKIILSVLDYIEK